MFSQAEAAAATAPSDAESASSREGRHLHTQSLISVLGFGCCLCSLACDFRAFGFEGAMRPNIRRRFGTVGMPNAPSFNPRRWHSGP